MSNVLFATLLTMLTKSTKILYETCNLKITQPLSNGIYLDAILYTIFFTIKLLTQLGS